VIPYRHRDRVVVDLYCGAGGVAEGYKRSGFWVIGVDKDPQPNYAGDEFIRADALDVLRAGRSGPVWHADVVHASPPCQFEAAYKRRPNHVKDSPNLIPVTRELLELTGLPYIIENVPGARDHLRDPVQFCGSSFGLNVRRHRLFESNVKLVAPPCNHGWQTPRFAQATNRENKRSTVEVGVWRIPLEVQQEAMGIGWMTLEELSEAIPPRYTEFIGRQLLAHIRAQEAVA
jgi:DNA (cytosine-5)-methyltransferase 1